MQGQGDLGRDRRAALRGVSSTEAICVLVVAFVGCAGLASLGGSMRASIAGEVRPVASLSTMPSPAQTSREPSPRAAGGAAIGAQAAIEELGRLARGFGEAVESFDRMGPAREWTRPGVSLNDLRRALGEQTFLSATDALWDAVLGGEWAADPNHAHKLTPDAARRFLRHESDVWLDHVAGGAPPRPGEIRVLLPDSKVTLDASEALNDIAHRAVEHPLARQIDYVKDGVDGEASSVLTAFMEQASGESDLLRDLQRASRSVIVADLSHIPSLKSHRAILHGDRHLILNLANLPSGDAAQLWRFVEAGLVEDGLLKTRRAFTEAGHEVPKWLESIDTLRDTLAQISKDYTDTTDAWRGPRVTTETEAGRDSLFEYVGFDWFLEESLRLRDGDVDLDVRGVPFRNELFAGLPPELESLDFLPGSIPDWENKRIYINSNDSQLTPQKPIARIVRRLFGE